LLIAQKPSSLPKLFLILKLICLKKDFLPLSRESDYPVMHSFILVNQFSSIGALFTAWKVALHFLIRCGILGYILFSL